MRTQFNGFIKWLRYIPSLRRNWNLTSMRATCVTGTVKDQKDLGYEETLAEWERKPALLRRFRRSPQPQLRCKYCGHYTQYIDPLEGLAYLGTNNCTKCGRGYPMPDFSWDGLDGQAYIYYRHSVAEGEFYNEFEKRYEVVTPRDHFLKKQ